MINPGQIYGGEVQEVASSMNPCIKSCKNGKATKSGRHPDFVSSLGRLLQDKTSEVGSVSSLCLDDDFTQSGLCENVKDLNGDYPISTQSAYSLPKPCSWDASPFQRDPAIADLYRILWLQNEQLSLLHKQVADLVNMKEKEKYKPVLVDMSTSTEDILPSHTPKTADAGVNTLQFRCPNCKTKVQKNKSSIKHSKRNEDLLLSLKDLDVPRLDYSSSNASVHINMNEYDITSSSEIDESDTSSDENPDQVGWTFYNNVIGQVNNLLDLAKQPMNFPNSIDFNESCQLPPSYLSKRVTFGNGGYKHQERSFKESDISMKINSLASKYINSGLNGQVKDISMCNVVTGNTNMSMATIRYMEKHHLIQSPDTHQDIHRRNPKHYKWRPTNSTQNRVLDVTAIRQQSKLLPKFD